MPGKAEREEAQCKSGANEHLGVGKQGKSMYSLTLLLRFYCYNLISGPVRPLNKPQQLLCRAAAGQAALSTQTLCWQLEGERGGGRPLPRTALARPQCCLALPRSAELLTQSQSYWQSPHALPLLTNTGLGGCSTSQAALQLLRKQRGPHLQAECQQAGLVWEEQPWARH